MEFARTIVSQAKTGMPPAPPPTDSEAGIQTVLGLSLAGFWLLVVIAASIILILLPRLASRNRNST